ncbi:MAG: GYF domain-containing protein [Luteolibacter sp.]
MNESSPDAWFYSHEGERIGPVTFTDLQIKAKEGGLNPRLDLVWKHGMDQWMAAGEIEGLFERREPEKKEDLAPPSDPYSPPEDESVEERMGREGNWPGTRRRGFLAAMIIFPILWTAAFGFAAPILDAQFGPHIMGVVQMAAPLVPLLVLIIFGVKRFANLGMSGAWILGFLVPLLNLWVGFRCFACPAGYGYHKKLDGIGIFLAIVYWLLILAGILAVAAVFALLFGLIGSPEMQEKIREVIQQVSAESPPK